MRRLSFWIVGLFVLLFAAGTTARAIGSRAENPLKALGFDVCDGQPCFMDIVLEQVTMDEVKTALTARGLVFQPDDNSVVPRIIFQYKPSLDTQYLVDIRGIESGKIISITIRHSFVPNSSLAGVYISDVINLLGSPCAVFSASNGESVTFLGRNFSSSMEGISVTKPINAIVLELNNALSCRYGVAWRGFMSYPSYAKMHAILIDRGFTD